MERTKGEHVSSDAPRIGDLVIVPYPEARERYGCPAEAGLLLEDRRSSVKVFFAEPDCTLWLERRRVERVVPGDLEVHPLVATLHAVARLVDADEVEVHERTADRVEARFSFAGADLALLRAVEEAVGPDLVTLRVEAGSMRYARLTLVLQPS